MKQKLLTIMTSVIMVATLVPTFAFATEPAEQTVEGAKCKSETTEALETIEEDNVVDIIEEDGAGIAKEVSVQNEINENFIQKISVGADVFVETIDDNLVYMGIDINEPVETLIYENDIEVEQYESYGLIFENETGEDTDRVVEEIEEVTDNINPQTSIYEKVKGILFSSCYADSIDEQYGKYGAIKATMRVIYKQYNGGTGNTQFVKYVRTSAKINKLKSGATLKKVIVKCRVMATYARSTPSWKKGAGKAIDSTASSTNSAPSFGKWYKASSPTSLWCWRYGYVCGCNAEVKVYWTRNGNTYNKSFTLNHNDSKL